MTHIIIKDMPCGYGKSTRITSSFDKREKYIVVLPYLSEVDRFKVDAQRNSSFTLTAPQDDTDSKSTHCEKLIRDKKSIVCTHALFYRLGTLATEATQQVSAVDFAPDELPTIEFENLLSPYHLIIDEVVNPFTTENSVRQVDFDEDYVAGGLAVLHDDGRIEPTAKWDEKYQRGSKTYNRALYEKAKSGALYRIKENLYVTTLPTELLFNTKSVTVYTYLSEGSLLLHFLRKHQKDHPGKFTMEVQRLDDATATAWREEVANALTVLSVPGLEKQKWNFRAQIDTIKKHDKCASLGHELRKLKDTHLVGVDLNNVMVTCARELWHANKTGQRPVAGRLAKQTRLFGHPVATHRFKSEVGVYGTTWSTTGVQFVPNTTRGTNKHSNCTHALYLFDQHPNPQLVTFLGWDRNSDEALEFCDAYALTELVQWLFRSAIRKGGLNGTGKPCGPRHKVTLYMPSQRMRDLLLNWLLTGRVHCGQVVPRGQRQEELLARLKGGVGAMAA